MPRDAFPAERPSAGEGHVPRAGASSPGPARPPQPCIHAFTWQRCSSTVACAACLSCVVPPPPSVGPADARTPSPPSPPSSPGYLLATIPSGGPFAQRACAPNPFAASCTSLAGRSLALLVGPACRVTALVLGDQGCSRLGGLTSLQG